jgi:hypothetical protein
MQIGFNYAWSHNRYGAQIGPDPYVEPDVWNAQAKLVASGDLSRVPLPPLFDHVDANLWYLRTIGVSVVRWFLLGNGFNYGPPSKDSPRLAPGFRSAKLGTFEPGRSFDPPSQIDRRFMRDFEELLVRFKRAGVKMIPSLIDFQFGSFLKYGIDAVRGIGAGGKADVITDPDKRKLFFDTMLSGLLDVSKKYSEQIYAWELINEPLWLCLAFGPLSRTWYSERVPEVTFEQMSDFLKQGIAQINDYKFPSTVGHRFRADLDRFPTCSLPQFHYYAKPTLGLGISIGPYKSDPPGIRGQRLFATEPKPILGEFDSDENRFGYPWSRDLGNTDSTFSRLNLLQPAGCELAVLWPEYAPDDDAVIGSAIRDTRRFAEERQICLDYDIVKLLGPTRQAIAQFLKLTLPTETEWVHDKRCGSTPGCDARIAKSVGI